ncbi:DUF1707 domain-containing protein [Streptomyces mobaraensis NBRC 13819 = DSM 40847]|uniref:DUF1707 domain-containing protein n=1 Tax=Streptomyces mobaraensis (strain ATCC 29032 / DSM 40847 / JCM 4168 / NBRC 13819 / NCIMB 11159 / IPCR 16-22) TaxID=1223523 RepID=M3BLP8_STRM1|nr:DUF1707 domain-containing protein [Streptomyces mobaraensis]EMF00515.1 hypothetical protein H340_10760 [Streptomyces mobaraensis NBRC 13819 = DSM 40847]QTT73891.1 DUF1707 domain-containing protein [Streptomyces mobaraensis NBRC 13819 = DSM 40847]
MSELPPVSGDDGSVRASHRERDAVVERLNEAAAEGRLDFAELAERVERALGARTHGELAALTADLPVLPGADPARPLTLKGGLHGAKREGRWQVPARIVAHGGMGGVVLDFTAAECRLPEVAVEAEGGMGGVVLIVPEGWGVNTDGMEGGVKDKTATTPRLPGTPLIRVSGTPGMAGVVVRHPKRRELRRSKRRAELAQG